jgi:undecaprenyl-diphosphatase
MLALVVIDALPVVIVGAITAGITGYFSIKWLLHFIKNNALSWFALYCFVLGTATLFVSLYVNR